MLKIVQLEELLHVRHSIFVIGNAGTGQYYTCMDILHACTYTIHVVRMQPHVGKTKILRSLHKTYQMMSRKPVWQDLNPKAVTNDELFGFINPTTREWRDGKQNSSKGLQLMGGYNSSFLFFFFQVCFLTLCVTWPMRQMTIPSG